VADAGDHRGKSSALQQLAEMRASADSRTDLSPAVIPAKAKAVPAIMRSSK